MTPTEKAEAALNTRLERLQVNLRATTSESSRRFLAQSLVVCIGLGEAMTDYVKMIGEYARGRYGEIKQTHATLTAQHADLLKAGGELLEQLKANPSDRVVRQEIERAQKAMESIKKPCVAAPTRCSAISRRAWASSTKSPWAFDVWPKPARPTN